MSDLQSGVPSQGRLSTDAQAMMMFETHKKSMGVAYLLWFFLGTLGAHRFYLGKTGSAVAMLILTIVGWVTIWLGIGAIVLVAVGIWVLVDAFLIPGIVRELNGRLARDLGASPVYIPR